MKAASVRNTFGAAVLAVCAITPFLFAGSGTIVVTAVTDLGGNTYELTTTGTSSLTAGDHLGCALSGGAGAVYAISTIGGGTVQITDTLTEDQGGAFGVPPTGTFWYATPTAEGFSKPPYSAPGWDAPLRRNEEIKGSMATQASTAVTITGGTLTGITDLAVADGGTGASTAADARTNLGLGSMATQASTAVTITGGTLTGITDLAVADGGTGASDAASARTNLGLGSMATQASTAVTITGGTLSGVSMSTVTVTSGTLTGITDLTVADGGTGASDAATARSNLSAQAQDDLLDDISGLTLTKGDILVYDGGTLNKLAVGANDYILTADSGESTGVKWAAASSSGIVLQRVSTTTSGTFAITGTVAFDDTPPIYTEGDEVLSLAITPQNASSTLVIEWSFDLIVAPGAAGLAIHLHDATGDDEALTTQAHTDQSGDWHAISGRYSISAGVTSIRTYRLVIGTSTGTAYVNCDQFASRYFGGTAQVHLSVTEYGP